MKGRNLIWTLTILALVFAFTACSNDDNPAGTEQFGEISGTVTFVGNWPAVGDIQVSAWSSWPPMGPPAAASDPFTAGNMVQTYKITGLSKGTYPVITVGWRDPANPAGAKVIGVYWANQDSVGVASDGITVTVQPIAIEISDNKMVWTGVDIKADLNIVK